MIIDYGNRTVSLKIVFFGPAMSGKTTAIRWLFNAFGCADRLVSIENTVGRTMFCDFGTLSFDLGGGWRIDAHVWSATGQDFYRSTREVVLVGTDGVVFVADSQAILLNENIASWRELTRMLEGGDSTFPVVVCLNKQDLPDSIDESKFREYLSLPKCVAVFRSVAKDGVNILEAFEYLFRLAMQSSLLATTPPMEI